VKLAIPGEDEEALDSDGPGLPKEQAAEEEQDAKAFAERRKMPISLAFGIPKRKRPPSSMRRKNRHREALYHFDFLLPMVEGFSVGQEAFSASPGEGAGADRMEVGGKGG
jgi:hypothetical protein